MKWLEAPWASSVERLKRDKFPHALMVCGPRGVGKRWFVERLGELLICDQPDLTTGQICGTCKQCLLQAADSHPDVRWYQPEKSRFIKIDQIRGLTSFAHESPQVGRRKVCILDRADQLNVNSANAFLKTLEEPAEDVALLLIQETGRPLLPTIASRCQKLSLPLPSEPDALDWLKAQMPESEIPGTDDLMFALNLARGAPTLAKEYLASDYLTQRKEAFEKFRDFMKGKVALVDAAKAFKPLGLDHTLQLFELWLNDLARIQCGGDASDRDAADMLGFLARENNADTIHRLAGLVRETREVIVNNVNPELEITSLLMSWLDLMPSRMKARAS